MITAPSFRALLIRLCIPVSWRPSPRRVALSLNRFSHVEADSAWQMLQALRRAGDDALAVQLFNNALEEVNHAAIFRRLAQRYADAPLPLCPDERQQLYDPARGMVEFEAYHYIGEGDVYRHFLAYASATNDPLIRRTFMDVRGDEAEHQAMAYRELVRLCGGEGAARRLIRRLRLRRARAAWTRASKAVGGGVLTVLLALLYFSVGALLARPARRRLGARAAAEPAALEPVRT